MTTRKAATARMKRLVATAGVPDLEHATKPTANLGNAFKHAANLRDIIISMQFNQLWPRMLVKRPCLLLCLGGAKGNGFVTVIYEIIAMIYPM